jgi:hypothetical protein
VTGVEGGVDASADGTTGVDTGDGSPAGDDAGGGKVDAAVEAGPIGSPCTPGTEGSPSYLGANLQEMSYDSNNPQCQSRLCLVNHFQGRVSCPYGQQADGTPRPGATSCSRSADAGCCTPADVPVTGEESDGAFANPNQQATVAPQCASRTADVAVYCSCSCAISGSTEDSNYCTCPTGFTCTVLESPLGGPLPMSGAFCVEDGTEYEGGTSMCTDPCDPTLKNCGAP